MDKIKFELMRCRRCGSLNLIICLTKAGSGYRLAGCGCGSYDYVQYFHIIKAELLEQLNWIEKKGG